MPKSLQIFIILDAYRHANFWMLERRITMEEMVAKNRACSCGGERSSFQRGCQKDDGCRGGCVAGGDGADGEAGEAEGD